ncbi:DNA primase [Herbaspirillum sp. Sphag1AN]|uniref:hypothetical protein n=1 Tax=unclassified Herbaspirillum TaxID=2624150 RepID=UPI0016122CAA|nr:MULTISPECIES: hypothetical protein [unclassified Herbaspirillum]MBB3214421.1 DNA primase [Herbaspirillum sp. Sphag1AN]MBB3247475.1 DNA primase [Herbaspirillum sp. Sphag64]
MIPKEYINELIEHSDIAKLISQEIKLHRSGRNYFAPWLRAALPAIKEGLNIRFATLPDGYGVSALVKQEDGNEDLQQAIAGAISLSEFLFQTLTERFDIRLIEEKAKLLAEMDELLGMVVAPRIKQLLQERLDSLIQDNLELLNSLEEHDRWFSDAISRAKHELVIVSPWIR